MADNTLWNYNFIENNIESGNADNAQHMVYINTNARSSKHSGNTWETNRIGLKCETIGISTSKTVPSLPIPGIGAITGEAQTLALDMGMASKNVNLTGIITDQFISKIFAQNFKNENRTSNDQLGLAPKVYMTAFEVAQLLHSSVDSSAFQKHQNLNQLIILIPSRVNHEYKYHKGLPERAKMDLYETPTEFTAIENLPLIPFTYKVRSQDNKGSIYAIMPDNDDGTAYSNFAQPIHDNIEVEGLNGFVRSFTCNIAAGSPFVTFTMDFEVAFVVG